jgi:hypothetical protein
MQLTRFLMAVCHSVYCSQILTAWHALQLKFCAEAVKALGTVESEHQALWCVVAQSVINLFSLHFFQIYFNFVIL